jgi:hypothetical protein
MILESKFCIHSLNESAESKGISSQSYDDIVNTETSDTPPSVSHVEKTQGHEYVSSVRTVALWVSTLWLRAYFDLCTLDLLILSLSRAI